jgi:cytochrome oxidase Cu insertion factor (SCO1/SenC/PrrC family)/thiol-disulfide isomerase/thioredoxin
MGALRLGRLLLAVAAALVVADLVAVLVFGAGRPDGSANATATRAAPLRAGVPLDRALPRLALIDERGRATSLRALTRGGRYVVLAPSLTLCHEVCPLTTGALMQLRSELRASGVGDRVVVAEATVDPWRDSPARVRAFLRRTGADVRFLTGTRAQIKSLWKTLGIAYERVPQDDPPDVDWWTHRPETFDVQHTDGVFVIDPRGRLRVVVSGMPAAGPLPRRLATLLNAEGRENLRAPKAPWTAQDLRDDVLHLMGHPAPSSADDAAPPPTRAQATRALAGSPPPLAALHAQGGALLHEGFTQRLAALHGRPVVINAWASWCPPCRGELPLFARAAARHGRAVAFLGLDVNDENNSARRLLATVPLSYPSYADPRGRAAGALAPIVGLPTTIYLDVRGRVVATHPGEYRSGADLEADIARHAAAG